MLDYGDVLKTLVNKNIDFTVVGGFAAVARGVVRVTMDLDLVVSLQGDGLLKIWEVLSELGFLPRQPITKAEFVDPKTLRSFARNKGAKAISFYHEKQPYLVVDILFSDEFKFKREDVDLVQLFGIRCKVANAKKLIALKRAAGREKDLEDIRELKKIEKK